MHVGAYACACLLFMHMFVSIYVYVIVNIALLLFVSPIALFQSESIETLGAVYASHEGVRVVTFVMHYCRSANASLSAQKRLKQCWHQSPRRAQQCSPSVQQRRSDCERMRCNNSYRLSVKSKDDYMIVSAASSCDCGCIPAEFP